MCKDFMFYVKLTNKINCRKMVYIRKLINIKKFKNEEIFNIN